MRRRAVLAAGLGVAAGAALLPTTAGPTPFRWADTSRGKPFSKDPSVIYFNGRYIMYYSVPPKADDPRWGQAVAISTDLNLWHRVRDIGLGICAADAIVIDGKVHLFYQTYSGSKTDSICHAVSNDGINFGISTTPIFHPIGAWTCGRAIDAEARIIGNQLFIYWATRDPSYKTQMLGCHSTALTGSANDFAKARWYQRSAGAILKPTQPWEKSCIEAPTIQHVGDTYVMFYAGAYNNQPQQIGVAYSRDGIRWSRASSKPFLSNGPRGSWNSSESGHPGIFYDPRTHYTWLFFQGNNDDGKTWWISKRRIIWSGHVPSLA